MCRPFKFLLFILAIQRYHSVDCYAPGSLIWSRSLQKFIPIANVSTFGTYEQEILAKSREKEKHNFQGEVLNLGYYEDYNMVHFVDDDTKVSGVCGEIWNTLADHSNFTLATIKVNTFDGSFEKDRSFSALGLISVNKIQIIPRISFSSKYSRLLDFTTPIWETRYRIYTQPDRKTDTNWIFNIFEHKVWFAILLIFFLLSALGYAMEKISIKVFDDEKHRHNLHDHLFYTFATLCSQGFIPDTLDRRSKIFSLSKKMFAWVMLIMLSSHVISHMSNVKLRPPFKDVESLLDNTDYGLISYNGSIAFDQFVDLVVRLGNSGYDWERFNYTLSQDKMYSYGCSKENEYAIFELEDMKETVGNRFCELVAVGKSYVPTWVTFGVSKEFKYKRTIDIGILKMREFGLIDRIRNRWLKTSVKTVDPKSSGNSAFVPVNFQKVLIIFVILSIGIVASATIFVLELIYFVYKRNQPRTVRRNILIGKDSLNAHRLTTDNYKMKRMRREIGLSDVASKKLTV